MFIVKIVDKWIEEVIKDLKDSIFIYEITRSLRIYIAILKMLLVLRYYFKREIIIEKYI